MQLHLVLVALCPVADKFEPANHLAYRKETKHFRSDDTSRIPLLAGNVPDLLEQVGGRLLSSAVGLASSTVHESGGVAEEVQSGLEVALHGLDGGWCHASLVRNELTELNTNTAVVCSPGDDSLYGAHQSSDTS